jgi:plastocyanin
MNTTRQTSVVTVMIILILVLAGGLYLYNKNKTDSPNSTPTTTSPTPSPTFIELSPTPTDLSNNIAIVNFAYTPQTYTLTVGGTITWTNNDSDPHTVTSEGNFDSGNMEQGDKYSRTFDETGEFDYICTYHPNMTGKIIVVSPGS